jgi:hypothetical protein
MSLPGFPDVSADDCGRYKDVWWSYTSTLVGDHWVPAIIEIFSES